MLTHTLLAVILIVVGVLAITALARRFAVSAPLLLLVVGVCASLVPVARGFRLDPEVVQYALFPPLFYAAALSSSYIAVRRNVRPIGVLAVGAPLVTAVVVAAATYVLLPDASFAAALALGAV
ncbi:MAG: Na+/H+ antiporter, partial [Streptosporangiales bacterium]